MKKILPVICLVLGVHAYSQDNIVPENVLLAFETKYPSAEDVEWKKKKENYQVEFFDFYQSIAIFDPEGTWLKTIFLISEDDLPELAYKYIDETYEIDKVQEVHMIEDRKQTVTYIVIVLVDGEKVRLNFSDKGILHQ